MSEYGYTESDLKWLKDHGAKKLYRFNGDTSYEVKVSRLLLTVSIGYRGYTCDISQNQLYYCPQVISDNMIDAIKQCIKSFQSDVSKVNRSNSQLKKKVADLFGVEENKK